MPGGLTEEEARARGALLDVDSYAVSLDLTDSDVVRAHTEIRFRCLTPGAASFADVAAGLTRATLNGQLLDPATVSGARLPLPTLAAGNLLVADTESRHARAGQALSWFTDPADGGRYVLGDCYPTLAPTLFCCFDQPSLRADFTLTLVAPAGWDCAANGPVVSRPPPGETGTWRFATVPGMKPYDFALCAGPYVMVSQEDYDGAGGTVRLSVRSRGALAGSAGLAQVGSVVSRTLGFYEKYLRTACPYPKYDVVFAPELLPLAVSLPGMMIVNENLLRRMAAAGDDLGPVVLAHEVAHLWFGCLVEGRWWDDLWLAEALATYLSYLAAEGALGLGQPWPEFLMQDQAPAYQADSLPGALPVSSPVATADAAMNRPPAITYSKGASVIRALAALIGAGAMRAGLADYLARYGGNATTLADLVGCWSRASGRDLRGWADEWLRTAGVNMLRPELALAPDGTVQSFAVVQRPPDPATQPRPGAGQGPLRTHRVSVGVYERAGDRLRLQHRADVEITGQARTPVPELAGRPMPAAFVLNEGGHDFARIRFDDQSWRTLADCAMDVGDQLTEAVCWNAAWDMTMAAELPAGEFTALVARRLGRDPVPAAVAELIGHVLTGADYYAPPAHRSRLREHAAGAALTAARLAEPGSRQQRALATGFAASAGSEAQLGLLRSWLSGSSLPSGLALDLELRGQILVTLSTAGLATDGDLAAFEADDPAGGAARAATCRAARPDPAAKQAAWTAALTSQIPHLAVASARAFWLPGQDEILLPYRDRYFAEALPAAARHETFTARRLATLLFPATLTDAATVTAASAALARGGLGDVLHAVLLEQRALLEQRRAARAFPAPPV
ncbi:MAG TPA: M1 family aminopeptidase [Streptosporangiaceae bacterium]|jgi:aminopeptidase N